jgi:hypothetical protein
MSNISTKQLEVTHYPFEPMGGISITATTTTGSEALPSAGGNAEQVLVTNLSATIDAYIAFGDSTVTATTDRLVIPYRTQVLLSIPTDGDPRATYVAVITASDTALLQFEVGRGI